MNESDPQRYVTLNGEKVPLNIIGILENYKGNDWDLTTNDDPEFLKYMEYTDTDPIYNKNMEDLENNVSNISPENYYKTKLQNIIGFVRRNTGLRKNSPQYNVSNKEGNIRSPYYRFDLQWVDYDVLKNLNNWNSVDSLYDYLLTQNKDSKDPVARFFHLKYSNELGNRDTFTNLLKLAGINKRIFSTDRRRLLNFIINNNTTEQPLYPNTERDANIPLGILLKYLKMSPNSMSYKNYINFARAMQELKEAGYEDWIPQEYKNNMVEGVQKKQMGGEMPQDDVQSQIIQLVQAAMQGDEQAVQLIQQIQQAAEQGNQEAVQIMEMINQVIQLMQGGQAQVARQGAKLNYIKKLRGECPEGFEMAYFKIGGKVCKKCQKMKNKVQKDCGGNKVKMHRAGGIMNDILIDMYSKGGSTAFGDRSHTPASANAQGRFGGRKAFNPNGTHQLDQHSKPNKFTAFGDEGKKKPTNSGLTGHHATGKAGRMQNKQSAGTTYKATAFGGDKQKRYHKGTGGTPRSGLRTIPGYPKGLGGKSGIGRMENGGSLNGIPFFQKGNSLKNKSNTLPEVTIKGNRPYRFDRRISNVGPGYNIISDILYNEYDSEGNYLGDLSGIMGGRAIYQTPFGNDTIYGGRFVYPSDTVPTYKLLGYNEGFMEIPATRNHLKSNKANFYRNMKKTHVAPYSDKQEKQAFKRAKKGN